MKAMVLKKVGSPLVLCDCPMPKPNSHQVLLKVHVCGVCRTDLHIIDGELSNPSLPLILGHQIVGTVVEVGSAVKKLKIDQRVGVPWLGECCEHCEYCLAGQENLCDNAKFTGYQLNGGFAEFCVANEHFCFPLPSGYPDEQAAPLLCAGLIGYRAYRMAGNANRLGLYGFGSAAHILIQVAKHEKHEVYAFTRPGDQKAQEFALSLGANWAGDSSQPTPQLLDAALIFAPIGSLVPKALGDLRKAGRVICAGIHMSDIPSFGYALLWEERQIRSVANLTRQDGIEFLKLAPNIPINSEITIYSLDSVNQALSDLRLGHFNGSAVIKIS